MSGTCGSGSGGKSGKEIEHVKGQSYLIVENRKNNERSQACGGQWMESLEEEEELEVGGDLL